MGNVTKSPWQKGKVERRIEAVKQIMAKNVVQNQVEGRRELNIVAYESAHACNQRPGGSGAPPATRLFGQRMKLYGELCINGGDFAAHPDIADPGGELSRRFLIRQVAREELDKYEANQIIARSVAARTRKMPHYEPGSRCFFYRAYPGKQTARAGALHGTGSGHWSSWHEQRAGAVRRPSLLLRQGAPARVHR